MHILAHVSNMMSNARTHQLNITNTAPFDFYENCEINYCQQMPAVYVHMRTLLRYFQAI